MTIATRTSTPRGGFGRRGRGGRRPMQLAAAAVLLALALTGCQRAAQLHTPAPNSEPKAGTKAQVVADRDIGVPTAISIPAIDLEAKVVPVGLTADGAMQVPGFSDTGWYDLGARPGAAGPAVIVGHVDSKKGPAVFYRLRDLEAGAVIEVGDGAGGSHRFKVERSKQYDKDALPVEEIWPDTDRPLLRLITCTGTFDRSTGHYRDNLVVYASLVA